MTGVKSCIDSAVTQGEISPANGRDLKRRYDVMVAVHGSQEAQRRLAEEIAAQALQKRRETVLRELRQQELITQLSSYRDARGRPDIARALMALLEHYGEAGGFQFSSIEGRRKAILGQAMADMEGVLAEFRQGAVTGRRLNTARLDNVVAELFGEATGDQAAAGLAQAWTRVSEDMRQRYNAAGGAIARREDWGLPQYHDARKIGQATLEDWQAFIIDRLDPSRMRHPLTGQPLTRAEVAAMLPDIKKRIVSDGWIDVNPLEPGGLGRGALYKQHAEHRFLVFKDAQSWREYQARFGRGDAFVAMMGHLAVMSRDIAAMEVLGPNPDLMIDTLKKWVKVNAAQLIASDVLDEQPPEMLLPLKGAAVDMDPREAIQEPGVQRRLQNYVDRMFKRIDDMYGSIRGTTNTPIGSTGAEIISSVRNVITAASLGSGFLSAIATDPAFQLMARQFAGISGRGTAFFEIVNQFRTMNQREAVASGLILEEALHAAEAQARFLGSYTGPEWSRFLAERVLAVSLLTPWTQAGKHAFGRAVQNTAHSLLGRNFAQLPEPFRRFLSRYGISAEDWEFVRQAAAQTDTGQPADAFLTPNRIIQGAPAGEEFRARQIAERYLEAIIQETEYAVPSGTVRGRTLFVGDNQPGTLPGEILRSMSQFKSFSVTVALMHVGRIATEAQQGRTMNAIQLGTMMLLFGTLGGALAMQLKSIASGKDTRPMDEKNFWFAAMAQGGGLGIWGDFLLAEMNRFGGGVISTAAGPLAGRLEKLLQVGPGNLRERLEGQKTNAGREVTHAIRDWTPGLGSLWFAKLAWQRLAIDRLQTLLDPEAYRAFQRQVQNARRDQRTEFWWRPGRSEPDRAPDLSRAFGGR
jgi:hypothetical protein